MLFTLAALIVGISGYVKFCAIPNAVAAAEVEKSRDSLNLAKGKIEAAERRDSLSRKMAAALLDSLANHRRADSATARRSAGSAVAQVDTFRLTVTDTMALRRLAGIIAARDTIDAAKDRQIASLTAEVGLWKVQASRADSMAAAWKQAFSEAAAQRDRYRGKSSAGCGPVAGAGGVAGLDGTVRLGGFVGLGCHL
jgi:hypothetical protein